MWPSLETTITEYRAVLKKLWEKIKITKDAVIENWYWVAHNEDADKWEVIANLTLSYRHLEDSIMRLWKVFQALDWGVSIYDKPPVQEDKETKTIAGYSN